MTNDAAARADVPNSRAFTAGAVTAVLIVAGTVTVPGQSGAETAGSAPEPLVSDRTPDTTTSGTHGVSLLAHPLPEVRERPGDAPASRDRSLPSAADDPQQTTTIADGRPGPGEDGALTQPAEWVIRIRAEHAADLAESPDPSRSAVDTEVWERLADCESSGDWTANTGNGFYGGLQFEKRSWDWAGGQQYAAWPHQATRQDQMAVAERLLEIHPAGWGAWPACASRIGLR